MHSQPPTTGVGEVVWIAKTQAPLTLSRKKLLTTAVLKPLTGGVLVQRMDDFTPWTAVLQNPFPDSICNKQRGWRGGWNAMRYQNPQ